jgi:membrane protease YdiL (CAAX protease family)
MGTVFAIVLTALGFGLIHAPQLGRAWGPVLVVFLVGLALTITRAVTKSVCPGLLMHAAYNFTLTSLLYIASGGFHHLDRLTQ